MALLHYLGRKGEFRSNSMTKRTVRNHLGSYKAKVALAALRGKLVIAFLAAVEQSNGAATRPRTDASRPFSMFSSSAKWQKIL